MSQQLEIDKDPFLILLTDALRAGPGSPAWHEAVAQLKTSGQQVDEYRLLIEAREALESGRDYRSVRAGPGFTRKVLTKLDEEPPTPRRKKQWPIATLIAVLGGILAVAVAVVIGYEIYSQGGHVSADNNKEIEELSGTYFSHPVLQSTFDQQIPAAWRSIGALPVEASDGLRVSGGSQIGGGGIVWTDPIPADQSFAVQVKLRGAATASLIPQVFVSNSGDFSAERATSPQEVVWLLQGQRQQVVVDGGVQKDAPWPFAPELTIRIVISHDLAIIESDGQRLFAGPSHLGDKPRYVGIRFVRTSPTPGADVAFESIQIDKR